MKTPLALYLRRRVAVQLPLGYASGLPYLLIGETLGMWMKDEGVSLKTIGVFTLCGLAYNFKLVWAPLIDRYQLPLLGRRRGWMLLFQLLLLGAIHLLGTAQPQQDPLRTASLAALVAFLSASFDIVVDAYKVDVLDGEERAPGVALAALGYRIGMFMAGAIALILADKHGWAVVYKGLSATMLVGVLATLVAPNPERELSRPRTLREAYVQPLAEFFARPMAGLIFGFIILFRFPYLATQPMNGPFLLELGFGKAQIGYWRKGVGLAATLLGGLVAGPAVARLGVLRALVIFGVLQALIHLSWAAMVFTGPQPWMLAIAVAVENFFIGLAVTAFDAYLMAQAKSSYSATQFAALAGVSSLGGRLLGATSGVVATSVGWPAFFIGTSILAIPALLLVRRLPAIADEHAAPAAPPPAAPAGSG